MEFFFESKTISSFQDFLREVNYGSLEKDERLFVVRDLLVDSITQKLSDIKDEHSFYGFVSNIKLTSKYKTTKKVNVDFYWKFDIVKSTDDGFCNYAKCSVETVNEFNYICCITFNCNSNLGGFDKLDFIKRSKQFLQDRFDSYALHEIKHALDSIDEIFIKPSTRKIANKFSSDKEKSQYVSQDTERDVYFLTVIEDLKRIKKTKPEMSLLQAMEESDFYTKFTRYIKPQLRNKYKTKVAYFWYSNYK
jgi:hypothetical protein